ncbi:MAG: translation elongation factor Ts [Arcobacteraceae bacterium]|jgi:elongation factor Ts|nr:translation elongation factor Ts [Arcobacteraceae bacterium]
MAEITAAMVKELRESTGAGMMDCKKALVETDGNMELAVDKLRESGLGKAAKKAGNVAAEGLITIVVNADNTKATMTEINSQTDFVAKNDGFINLTQEVTAHVQATGASSTEELMTTTINGVVFEEYMNSKIATIGENLVARKMATISTTGGVVNGYVHTNGRVGVIVSAVCAPEAKEKTVALLKSIAMHASAMKPTVLSYTELDAEFVEKELLAIRAEVEKENEEFARLKKPLKRIPEFVSKSQLTPAIMAEVEANLKEALKASGKPEKIWDNILPGQIERFITDNTPLDQRFALLSQAYVMDDKKTVEQAIADTDPSIKLVDYIRFELGEGIEKQVTDFASEVAAQLG